MSETNKKFSFSFISEFIGATQHIMATKAELSNAFFSSDVLSDDFFAEIIEKKFNISRDSFKIRLVVFTSATGKSENYVSDVYRVKIKIELLESGEQQVIDVIMKASFATLPELKKMSVFPREQLMYEDVVRSFEDIWKEKTEEEISFAPKCYKVDLEPFELIVLEDLKAEGYGLGDRKEGLGLIETKMALAKLAKFHAASVIRYQKVSRIF